jgi:methionine-rich copper-binding protein CopC
MMTGQGRLPTRLWARHLSALGLLGLSVSWCPTPGRAEAHAIIVESEPTNGATVGAPKRVVLRFNSRLEKGLCSVMLVGPQRRTILLLRQDERAPADTLIYGVPELPPGGYQLRWKVLAADGHVTEGAVHFQVAAEVLPK